MSECDYRESSKETYSKKQIIDYVLKILRYTVSIRLYFGIIDKNL